MPAESVPATPPGLCARCRWNRVVPSSRSRLYQLCGRSQVDPRFPKYPMLPVLTCRGFEPVDSDPDRSTTS